MSMILRAIPLYLLVASVRLSSYVTWAGDELCVVGCTPYVDMTKPNKGIEKYRALAEELADTCDIVVHLGDTKPGKTMGCNATTMTAAVHVLVDAGAPIVLYAPGDNELNDCHRLASAPEGERYPTEMAKASVARQFLIDDLNLTSGYDVTGNVPVIGHDWSFFKNPAAATADECYEAGNVDCETSYSCDFDKYIEMDHYAVATLEVIGSHWYLDDERWHGYPHQDEIDPLSGRLAMYINAKDCALDWIEYAAGKACQAGKKAVFFMLHATFYSGVGEAALGTGSIGPYYNEDALFNYTAAFDKHGEGIRKPYQPLFDKLAEVAMLYSNMTFQIVHSDAHRWLSTRLKPTTHNSVRHTHSHHNVRIHQVEGASRALTMYTRFTVDPHKFQPVTAKEEWSHAAYDLEPYGHNWVPYKAPYKY